MRRRADTALNGSHSRLPRPERRFRQTLTTVSRAATAAMLGDETGESEETDQGERRHEDAA